jgi:small subunit ribosomal protein S6
MENLYCTIFIVDISQNPDEVETVTSRIQQLIEDHGGIIKKVNRWGKRRLAYLIRNKSHGFYVEIEFKANSRLNIPRILEDEYRLNDRILRDFTYVVTKKELLQRQKFAKLRLEEKTEAITEVVETDIKENVEEKIEKKEDLGEGSVSKEAGEEGTLEEEVAEETEDSEKKEAGDSSSKTDEPE